MARGTEGAEPDGDGGLLFWRGVLYATVLWVVLYVAVFAVLWRAPS